MSWVAVATGVGGLLVGFGFGYRRGYGAATLEFLAGMVRGLGGRK